MAINTIDLADLLAQSLQQLNGPLKDAVTALLGLKTAADELEPPSKKLKGFFQSLGDGFPGLTKKAKTFFDGIGDWWDRLQRRTTMGNVASAASTVAGGAASAAAAASPMGAAKGLTTGITQQFNGLLGKLQSIFGPIASLVGKMNPALVEMFERAMDDLAAVMGEILQPILQAAIPLVRKLADILLTMKPAFDPIIEVIVELYGIIADLLVPIFQVITPLIQLFGAMLKTLMPVFHIVADALKWILGKFTDFANFLIKLWNMIPGVAKINPLSLREDNLKSSVGKAIYTTGYTGGEQLGKDTRMKALMSIGPEAEKPDVTTAKNTGLMKSILDQIGATLTIWMNAGNEVINDISDGVNDFVEEAKKSPIRTAASFTPIGMAVRGVRWLRGL